MHQMPTRRRSTTTTSVERSSHRRRPSDSPRGSSAAVPPVLAFVEKGRASSRRPPRRKKSRSPADNPGAFSPTSPASSPSSRERRSRRGAGASPAASTASVESSNSSSARRSSVHTSSPRGGRRTHLPHTGRRRGPSSPKAVDGSQAVACPGCREIVQYPQSHRGQVQCPACGTVTTVGSTNSGAAAAVAEPAGAAAASSAAFWDSSLLEHELEVERQRREAWEARCHTSDEWTQQAKQRHAELQAQHRDALGEQAKAHRATLDRALQRQARDEPPAAPQTTHARTPCTHAMRTAPGSHPH